MLQPPLRRNCCGRCIRLPRPRLSPIRPWPVVVKQNPYDSAHGHHVEHCGNAHLKDQVDRRLDSDDHQEREHGTEEKDGGNRPFRPGPKVTHRWTFAGLLTGDSTTPTVKDPLAPGPRGGMSAAPRGSCLALSPRRGGQRGDRRGSAVQRPRPMRGSCSVPLPWLPFLRLSRRGFLLAVAELCARSPARLSTQPSRGAWARARPLLRSATQRPSQAAHRASPSLGTGGMLRLQWP